MLERTTPGASERAHQPARGQRGPALIGRYEPRAIGEVHSAPTDGLVLACAGPAARLDGFALTVLRGSVDGAPVAAATAGSCVGFDAGWNSVRAGSSSSFSMPVPAGSDWLVERLDQSPGSERIPAWVHWVPIDRAVSARGDRPVFVAPDASFPEPVARPWEDFQPAVRQLVHVLEEILERPLEPERRRILHEAISRLI